MATLAELTVATPRVALVGLAKNTGKTVALRALLAELAQRGRTVGVTSVGRDGEEYDVIDARIEKPAVQLAGGSLVATTDGLLRASGVPHELLERTGIRTPLGEVLIARFKGTGTVEVAGPSAAADARRVADAMLGHGAEQVLIDGAIDRRASSSPDVADGLVMSTGAILSEDIEEVVGRTAEAVELTRLAPLDTGTPEGRRVRDRVAELGPGIDVMLEGDEQLTPRRLPPRFVLTAEPALIADLLRRGSAPRWLLISGALPEAFLEGLVPLARRRAEPLKVLAADPTRVFVANRGPGYYLSAGIELSVLEQVDLLALTVNPVAPQSHSFDSERLRAMLSDVLQGVPIFDVMHSSYAGPRPPMSHRNAQAGAIEAAS